MSRPARVLALGLTIVALSAPRASADSTGADTVDFEGCAPAWVDTTRALIAIELEANPSHDVSRLSAIDVKVVCTLRDYRIGATDRLRGAAARRTLPVDSDDEDGRHVALVVAELLAAAAKGRDAAAAEAAQVRRANAPTNNLEQPGTWRHTLGVAGSVLRFGGQLGMSTGGGVAYEARQGIFGASIAFDAHVAQRSLLPGTVDVALVGITPMALVRRPVGDQFALAALAGPSFRFVRMAPVVADLTRARATPLDALVWGLSAQARAELLVSTHGTLCVGITVGYLASTARGRVDGEEVLVAGGLWQLISAGWSWRF